MKVCKHYFVIKTLHKLNKYVWITKIGIACIICRYYDDVLIPMKWPSFRMGWGWGCLFTIDLGRLPVQHENDFRKNTF